ncbi:MAG: EAL domain-containing protein [Magnetococcales bacterium]|nr:EAL domain-containing protein [Magnetococcales bacterium]
MSIPFKFILLLTLLLLAGLGVSSSVSFTFTEEAMEESALTTMDQTNHDLLHKIDLFHKKIQSDILMSLEHPAFKRYFDLPETRRGNRFDNENRLVLTTEQLAVKADLDAWAVSMQKRFPIVESCLIDQGGQEHARITFGRIASIEEFSSEEAQNAFFAPAMALPEGRIHIQYPYMSQDANKWVFAYLAPIVLADGSKAGVFHNEIPVSLFQELIRQHDMDKNSRLFLLDPSGVLIADSWRDFSMDRKNTPETSLQHYLPMATSLNASPRFTAILERMRQGSSGADWYEEGGERQHVTFRPLPTFGWSIGHIRPHHALLQGKTSLTNVRLAFALTTLGTLLATILIVWFQVNKIAMPLRGLARSAQKIADGNLDFNMRIQVGDLDEVGILAHSFNRMLLTLSQTTDTKEFTENILRAMVDGLLVLDMDNRIRRVNRAMLELLEEKEENLLNRHLDSLLPDPEFCATMFRDLLANRLFRSQETAFRTRDGRDVAVSISSNLLRHGDTMTGMVILAQDIRIRKNNEEQLHFLANFDVLTRLPNRALLQERLSQTLVRAPWRTTSVGVLHCALDRFKSINDTLGHRSGDELLKETANRLRACVRGGDTVARIGGDEFLVLLMDVARAEDIIHVAKKISHAIAMPLTLSNGQEVFVTASIGISVSPENGSTPDELLKNANIATSHAKVQGKNQFRFFSAEMNRKGAERLAMEADLRRAVERGELEAHYQPRWDLRRDCLAGAEALVRWRRGGGKPVSPADFLPLAEELGLIESFDLWMLENVCRQARQWRDAGYPHIRLSINLSHHLFGRKDLVELIRRALDENGLEPDALELELTEAIVMRDVTHAMSSLLSLREMWIHLAVDDFGTGYSSFSHLRRLPVHILKIDRSFVREITTNKEDAAITHAIITMAHTLNLRTTAEGAEEQAQRDLLTSLGCDELQGYLISRPVPAAEMEEKFLKSTQRTG